MKLIYVVTEDWYFLSHRLPTARAAQRAGFDVAVIARDTGRFAAIKSEGMRAIPFPFERRSLNPFRVIADIVGLVRIYREEKPDVLHHIAMKPVLCGSIAAGFSGIRNVINAFPGLGYVFTSDARLAKLLRGILVPVFRFLLKRDRHIVLLQNDDDLKRLSALRMIPERQSIVIRGSGVDMDAWPETPLPPVAPDFICVFAGRMIGIKGLETLKAAFERLAATHPHIRLWLCGAPDPSNPASWSDGDMLAWAKTPNVVYKGQCAMQGIWPQAHLAIQPSWGGEGIPKSMLEAASCGRPFVATDVPGCREVARDGVNGLLVPPRDAEALAMAVARLADDERLWRSLAARSREVVARDLSADAVGAQAETMYRRFCG